MIAVMRDDPAVVELVHRARGGDRAAWDQVVDRYSGLVWSICRRHELSGADADDVGATVWLRLVERLDTIVEPAALPGWIAPTARRECLQLLRVRNRHVPVDDERLPDQLGPASDEWLLEQEQQAALRVALARLSERCRLLLSMLFADPPVPYSEISSKLGLAVGSIGPSRQRCLKDLRSTPEIAALMSAPRPAAKKR